MYRSLDTYRKLTIGQLAKRVFTFDESPADETFFRNQFVKVAMGERGYGDRGTLDGLLWDLIYERTEGHSCRYLYFNERAQRLYVDWEFRAWAEKALDEIRAKLQLT